MMTAPTTVAEQIQSHAIRLAKEGLPVNEILLGREQLEDMHEWIDCHYENSVDAALQARLPFYWHGIKITPSGQLNDFRILV